MDEVQIKNLQSLLQEMENDELVPFSSEEKMPLAYRDEWNEGVEEPRYTNSFLQYLKDGEFESREQVFELFDDFFQRCEEFIQSLEEANVLLALFYNFKETYLEKIRHSMDKDEEVDLKIINDNIKKMNELLPHFFEDNLQPFEDSGSSNLADLHQIPKKLFV